MSAASTLKHAFQERMKCSSFLFLGTRSSTLKVLFTRDAKPLCSCSVAASVSLRRHLLPAERGTLA